MKLYKFSDPSTTETILLVTPRPCSDHQLRGEMGGYDAGGMNFDLFTMLINTGTISEVHSLGECGEGWTLDMVPYGYMDGNWSCGSLEMIFRNQAALMVASRVAAEMAIHQRRVNENQLWEIRSLFHNTHPIVGRICQFPAFRGRKFVENERGEVVLEVIWGSFNDQKFYAEAYQNTKFLLEYIKKLQAKLVGHVDFLCETTYVEEEDDDGLGR